MTNTQIRNALLAVLSASTTEARVEHVNRILAGLDEAPKPRKASMDLDVILPVGCMARRDYEDAQSWATSPDLKVRERGVKLARAIVRSARECFAWMQNPARTGPVATGFGWYDADGKPIPAPSREWIESHAPMLDPVLCQGPRILDVIELPRDPVPAPSSFAERFRASFAVA